MATVDDIQDAEFSERTSTPITFPCRICGEVFESRGAVVTHFRTEHSDTEREAYRASRGRASAPPKRGPGRPRKDGSPARRRTAAAPRAPRAPRISEVQLGLTLAYGLCGQAFSMFGPEPKDARQAVGTSMAITAVPAGAGLDKALHRTPVYPWLEAFIGGAGILNDLAPLGIPVLVGMYSYAPDEAKRRLRPMTVSVLGLIVLQSLGPEPPATPEEMTPIAIPEWIRDLVNGLLPLPSQTTSGQT